MGSAQAGASYQGLYHTWLGVDMVEQIFLTAVVFRLRFASSDRENPMTNTTRGKYENTVLKGYTLIFSIAKGKLYQTKVLPSLSRVVVV